MKRFNLVGRGPLGEYKNPIAVRINALIDVHRLQHRNYVPSALSDEVV